ncbi:MAG: methyltransferase, TIGR04325 family [Kofleriaceae bacterium]
MKAALQRLAPKLLVGPLQRFAPKAATYATYDEAMADCTARGYENDAIVRVVVEKNLRYREKMRTQPVLRLDELRSIVGLGLARRGPELNVLDFGGGGGYHYTIANLVSSPADRLRWNVVETPAMARGAAPMATDALKFFDDVHAAARDLGRVDLVFVSSSISYTREPLETLRLLAGLGARYLHITRTPLSLHHDKLIVKQTTWLGDNGPGPMPDGVENRQVSCPDTAVSKAAFEAELRRSYRICAATTEDRDIHRTARESLHYYGYLCERIAS